MMDSDPYPHIVVNTAVGWLLSGAGAAGLGLGALAAALRWWRWLHLPEHELDAVAAATTAEAWDGFSTFGTMAGLSMAAMALLEGMKSDKAGDYVLNTGAGREFSKVLLWSTAAWSISAMFFLGIVAFPAASWLTVAMPLLQLPAGGMFALLVIVLVPAYSKVTKIRDNMARSERAHRQVEAELQRSSPPARQRPRGEDHAPPP